MTAEELKELIDDAREHPFDNEAIDVLVDALLEMELIDDCQLRYGTVVWWGLPPGSSTEARERLRVKARLWLYEQAD